jgi:thymidine kinase
MLGSLEVIVGCMFAGKTETLISKATKLTEKNKKFIVLKPSIDNRYSGDNYIITHKQAKQQAIIVNPVEINQYIKQFYSMDYILIDEVQFFHPDIIIEIEVARKRGVGIICAGLVYDYKKEVFRTTDMLLTQAVYNGGFITYLTANCDCGKEATLTQRTIESDKQILVGGDDIYKAVCEDCYGS